MEQFVKGQAVEAQNAFGKWVRMTAVSGIERGHDMLIVWVELPDRRGDTIPWPAEYVRPAFPGN